MGRVAVFIFWFFTAAVACGQPLSEVRFTAEGCGVAPGGIGQVRLRWSGLSSSDDVHLVLDAPAHFTFLNLPSTGDLAEGEAMVLFMAHPFTAAGTHVLRFELVQGTEIIATALTEVEVEPRYSVESTVIKEGRDTIKVLHMNTGNIAVFIGGEQLIPGEATTLDHIRVDEYALAIQAQSQEWDTNFTIALNERFYPHETARPKAATKPLLTIAAQRQWAQSGAGFGMWNARLHKKNWQMNLSQWNSNFRGAVSFEDERTIIRMGNANVRVIEQLRPKNGLYALGSFNANRTDFYFDQESVLLRHRFKRDWGAIAPGGVYFDNRILPALQTRLEGNAGQLDWEAVGNLHDVRWEVGNRTLKTYGRALYVPQNFQGRTIQQTSGLVGTSAIIGSVRWSHQSSIFGPRSTKQFHNAQLQWGRGRVQWNARTQMNGRGQNFFNLQSTYTKGRHSFSGRFQQQSSKAIQQTGWTGQYRWNGAHNTFSCSAQQLSSGFNLRAQGSATFGGYRISGQLAYASLYSDQWFYQTTLSKSIHNHNITLSSSRRIPLRLGWNANFFPERSHATLKGRIEGMDGKAIQGAMITCQGRTIQSNSEGVFTFQHLTGSEASIEIHPESLPFAKFPSAGYSQTVSLTKHSQNITIQCFTTSAIQGFIDISFFSAPAVRPTIDWNTVSIQLVGPNDSLHECRVNALGHYHISNLKSGVYELHIRGLGKYFTALPMAVEIVEEQILEQPLVIQEIPNQIPFQEL